MKWKKEKMKANAIDKCAFAVRPLTGNLHDPQHGDSFYIYSFYFPYFECFMRFQIENGQESDVHERLRNSTTFCPSHRFNSLHFLHAINDE